MTDDGSWVSMMMMVVVVMLMSLWSLPAIQPTGHQLWNGQFATKNNTRHFLGEAIGWSLFFMESENNIDSATKRQIGPIKW